MKLPREMDTDELIDALEEHGDLERRGVIAATAEVPKDLLVAAADSIRCWR